MKIRILIPPFAAAFLLLACEASEAPADRQAALTAESPDPEARRAIAQRKVPGGADDRELSRLDGRLEFSIDGEPKHFGYIVAEHTSYHRLSSKIHAQPDADSREAATIIFMNVDLKDLDYPVELPLPRGTRVAGKPTMAMITTGFGYIDEDANEWAGPGRVQLDSFSADGIIDGSFSDVSLPHTENELPDLVLTAGRFSVRLGAD